jgi:hypothetical protein
MERQSLTFVDRDFIGSKHQYPLILFSYLSSLHACIVDSKVGVVTFGLALEYSVASCCQHAPLFSLTTMSFPSFCSRYRHFHSFLFSFFSFLLGWECASIAHRYPYVHTGPPCFPLSHGDEGRDLNPVLAILRASYVQT